MATYVLVVVHFLDLVAPPGLLVLMLPIVLFKLIYGVVMVVMLQCLVLVSFEVCVYNFVHQ